MGDQPMTTDSTIAALLREREGYVRTGKSDRVAQVDEQLALRGYEGTVEERPEPDKVPKGRHAPTKRTA